VKRAPPRPELSVVIPVFNERRTLPEVLARVARAPFDAEILVVDDGSTDGGGTWLRNVAAGRIRIPGLTRSRLRAFFHNRNRGKGAALRTAFAHVRGRFVVIQDADLEYDPADWPALLGPLREGRADVVYGTRLAGGGAHRVLLFWHYVGNRMLTLFSNMLTNLNLTDMETGAKAFRGALAKRLRISSNRFGVEPELTAKFSRMGCRIYEVPVSYHGRTYAQGKKITWRDGLAALWHIVRFRLFD
jgi:glycosyltransferase involved in cell wall biosynthesis